ncbi:DUF5304 domain-containing protein [Streptomyces abikoensis]|uniref:DUF5304 domain-containing protein n=1 Tax=Streptomyces abikoensis TaxID=97398 RepID=UPI001673F21B|nr:DUF5304 domain-containing protein [Streptomyces abikoensis]GGP69467.1 hypothetical protein GCM10010214_50170 [Streptomyces abikoensis]
MSEATERPGPGQAPDPDAWERACAEDLAAENTRRAAGGPGEQPGSAAEELRRLVEAVAGKVTAQLPLAGAAAQGAVREIVETAKAAAQPVIERNPQVFDHLAAAGSELLAAYRAAVTGQEARWTRDEPAHEPPAPRAQGSEPREGEAKNGGSERIDLD